MRHNDIDDVTARRGAAHDRYPSRRAVRCWDFAANWPAWTRLGAAHSSGRVVSRLWVADGNNASARARHVACRGRPGFRAGPRHGFPRSPVTGDPAGGFGSGRRRVQGRRHTPFERSAAGGRKGIQPLPVTFPIRPPADPLYGPAMLPIALPQMRCELIGDAAARRRCQASVQRRHPG